MAEKAKSIEELRDKVHSGLELLSDEELSVLFEDTEQIAQGTPTQPQTVPNPSVAPVKAEVTPPVTEPSKGQADLMNLVPEKFRDKDEAASLNRMTKALQDTEAELTRRSQELSQLQSVVQELSRKPREEFRTSQTQQVTQPAAQPTKVAEPDVEIDDMSFLDSPVANAVAIARKVAKEIAEETSKRVSVEQIRDYDTFTLRRSTFEKFKADHSDFDNFKSEFAEACRLHPEWDNDVNGLPRLYDLAKTLAKARGTQTTTNVPAIDIEKLKAEIRAEVEASSYEKAKQAVVEEIKRRKAAAGSISSNPLTTPQERVSPFVKTEPLTDEEKIFKDMVDSGPRTLKELGQYGDILSLKS